MGAYLITNTILGVPYYNYSILGPKTPFAELGLHILTRSWIRM